MVHFMVHLCFKILKSVQYFECLFNLLNAEKADG